MSDPITRSAPAGASTNAPPQLDRFLSIRALSETLAAPLSPEDQTVQSMADASPTKWHLAHTTWFFETFLLRPHAAAYRLFDPAYGYLFNSYYEAVGPRHPRPARGLLSRPGIDEIARYRAHIDGAMRRLILTASGADWRAIAPLIELGLNHEQQHQELILMDIQHVLSCNALDPVYDLIEPEPARGMPPLDWLGFMGGLREICLLYTSPSPRDRQK